MEKFNFLNWRIQNGEGGYTVNWSKLDNPEGKVDTL